GRGVVHGRGRAPSGCSARARAPAGVPTRLPPLGQTFLAVLLLVLLVPLRLIGVGRRELPLDLRLLFRVFRRRTLAGGGLASRDREGDHDQRHDDHGEDEPRDHERSVPRSRALGHQGATVTPPHSSGSTSRTVCVSSQRWPAGSSTTPERSPYSHVCGSSSTFAPAARARSNAP